MEKIQIESIKKAWEKYGELHCYYAWENIRDTRMEIGEEFDEKEMHLFIDGNGNFRLSSDYDGAKWDEAVFPYDSETEKISDEIETSGWLLEDNGSTLIENAIELQNNGKRRLSEYDCEQLCAEIDGITREKLEKWGFTIEE